MQTASVPVCAWQALLIHIHHAHGCMHRPCTCRLRDARRHGSVCQALISNKTIIAGGELKPRPAPCQAWCMHLWDSRRCQHAHAAKPSTRLLVWRVGIPRSSSRRSRLWRREAPGLSVRGGVFASWWPLLCVRSEACRKGCFSTARMRAGMQHVQPDGTSTKCTKSSDTFMLKWPCSQAKTSASDF